MRILSAFLTLMVVALLLRSTALTALAARGVVLDVLAFVTVVWGLRRGESWGTGFGFALGLAADLDAAHWLGRHALLLSLLGYAVGRLSHTLVRESPRAQAVLLLGATVAHQTWVTAFDLGGPAGWPYLVQRAALAALATVPAGTLVLWAARRIAGRPVFTHATSGTQS